MIEQVPPPKKRTLKEIEAAYTEQCAFIGHKSRMVADAKAMIPRLESEINEHLKNTLLLSKEEPKIEESPEKAKEKSDAKETA